MTHISYDRLIELVDYDCETGLFTRKKAVGRSFEGRVLGYKKNNGYIAFTLDSKKYFAHRLAWLFVHKKLPEHDVDHIDGNRTNNKIANLRDIPRSLNLENSIKAKSSNKSTGLIGSYFHEPTGKFMSRIQVNKKDKYLGLYETAQLAHEAYMSAKKQLHKGYVA
jgi:hypothetical protein